MYTYYPFNIIRDGKKVWPTCPQCGCRLEMNHINSTDIVKLSHFGINPDRDARGCECAYIGANWNILIEDVQHLFLGVN